MIDFIKALFFTVLNFFSPAEDISIVEAAPETVITLPVQELMFDEEQLTCAALNIYYEARNQSELGQIAVSQVVFNRAKEDFWPNNICDVVKQGSYTTGRVSRHQCQFSWYCDGLSDRPKEFSTWQNALDVARYSYFAWSYGYDITEGATNYHSSKVRPIWRNDKGMSYVKSIHDHHFYYWDTKSTVASSRDIYYNQRVAKKGVY